MLGRRPYSFTSFEKMPGSIWGRSITQIVRDPQMFINVAVRSLANNMGLASGPMIEVIGERLADDEPLSIYPWRLWQGKPDPTGGNAPILRVYNIDSHAAEFLQIIQHWYNMADEVSAIPRYTYGSDKAKGAGATMGGLSMLMGASAKGLRQVLGFIDMDVIEDNLSRLYEYNMRFHPDPSAKGDLIPVSMGSKVLLNKESAQMQRDRLLQATANPLDMQIIGPDGRAEMLRGAFEAADMPDVVPDEEELQQQLQPPGPPGLPPGQPGQPPGQQPALGPMGPQ